MYQIVHRVIPFYANVLRDFTSTSPSRNVFRADDVHEFSPTTFSLCLHLWTIFAGLLPPITFWLLALLADHNLDPKVLLKTPKISLVFDLFNILRGVN